MNNINNVININFYIKSLCTKKIVSLLIKDFSAVVWYIRTKVLVVKHL